MSLALHDHIEISIFCTSFDQCAINVLTYEVDGISAGTPLEQDVVTAFGAYISPYLRPMFNDAVTFNGCALRKVNSLPFGGYYYAKVNSPGTNEDPGLPRQTAGLISWRTPVGTRHGRGRTYVPFPTSPAPSGIPRPSSAYMTAITALAGALKTTGAMTYSGLNTITLDLEITNRANLARIGVDHFVLPQKWATQRRRGSFGRVNKAPDAIL